MNEFRAKLDGSTQLLILQRKYATADAVSCLQQLDRESCAGQSRCRCDSRGSASDDDHIRFGMVGHGIPVQELRRLIHLGADFTDLR